MEHRINEEITSKQVLLVLDGNTEQMDFESALEKADGYELDLVEVSCKDGVAICKLMDYSKYLFESKKKEKAKKTQALTIKELRLGCNIATRDLEIKVNQAKKWLASGDRVVISVRHRNREIQMMDNSVEMLKNVRESLMECGKVFQDIRIEGKNVTIVVDSIVKKKN